MLRSLIYVSRSAIEPDDVATAVDRIVTASRRHNTALDVTGALVFTGTHFAQILEGTGDALELLMAKIQCDDRHRCVDVLQNTEVARRSFVDWSMAFSGPSTYLTDHIRPFLLEEPSTSRPADAVERLIVVMQDLKG